jgi:hypothetical protein
MWHHVTNHLIISNDKDSNSEMNENYMSVTFFSIGQDLQVFPENQRAGGVGNALYKRRGNWNRGIGKR